MLRLVFSVVTTKGVSMGMLDAYERWINHSPTGEQHNKRLGVYGGMLVGSLLSIVVSGFCLDVIGYVSSMTSFFVLILLGGVGLGTISILCFVVEFFYAGLMVKQYRTTKHLQ